MIGQTLELKMLLMQQEHLRDECLNQQTSSSKINNQELKNPMPSEWSRQTIEAPHFNGFTANSAYPFSPLIMGSLAQFPPSDGPLDNHPGFEN